MTLTRKMLKAMGIEEEKIDQIIEAHAETVDGLNEKLKTAEADGGDEPEIETVAVSFTSATLDKASHDTYGTSIRFDTEGLQWETYHNWVSAEDWASIADQS